MATYRIKRYSDKSIIRINKPHIKIKTSESSSSYNSESPKDNYYYENNSSYDSEDDPLGSEEEIVSVPRNLKEKSDLKDFIENLTGESFDNLKKNLLFKIGGTAAGTIAGSYLFNKLKDKWLN